MPYILPFALFGEFGKTEAEVSPSTLPSNFVTSTPFFSGLSPNFKGYILYLFIDTQVYFPSNGFLENVKTRV